MGHNHNHNWVGLHPHIYVTRPNHLELVHFSLVAVHQPVSTGPLKDQLGPVAVGPDISLNQFYNTKSTLLTNVYFVLNKINYMTPCEQVLMAVTGCLSSENKIIRKRKKNGPIVLCL